MDPFVTFAPPLSEIDDCRGGGHPLPSPWGSPIHQHHYLRKRPSVSFLPSPDSNSADVTPAQFNMSSVFSPMAGSEADHFASPFALNCSTTSPYSRWGSRGDAKGSKMTTTFVNNNNNNNTSNSCSSSTTVQNSSVSNINSGTLDRPFTSYPDPSCDKPGSPRPVMGSKAIPILQARSTSSFSSPTGGGSHSPQHMFSKSYRSMGPYGNWGSARFRDTPNAQLMSLSVHSMMIGTPDSAFEANSLPMDVSLTAGLHHNFSIAAGSPSHISRHTGEDSIANFSMASELFHPHRCSMMASGIAESSPVFRGSFRGAASVFPIHMDPNKLDPLYGRHQSSPCPGQGYEYCEPSDLADSFSDSPTQKTPIMSTAGEMDFSPHSSDHMANSLTDSPIFVPADGYQLAKLLAGDPDAPPFMRNLS